MCLWFKVIYSAFGSFFIPMSIMLYVYSKIFCVLTSRQSRISRTEVSLNILNFSSRIFSSHFGPNWISGMRTCYWCWQWICNVRNGLKLSSKLKGPDKQYAWSTANYALWIAWICKNSINYEKQFTWKCQQQLQPRKFRYSLF